MANSDPSEAQQSAEEFAEMLLNLPSSTTVQARHIEARDAAIRRDERQKAEGLAEALREQQYTDGHFDESCGSGLCRPYCARARAVLSAWERGGRAMMDTNQLVELLKRSLDILETMQHEWQPAGSDMPALILDIKDALNDLDSMST